MTLYEAVISGLKKPCGCAPGRLAVEKRESRVAKHISENPWAALADYINHGVKIGVTERWCAVCPDCGALYLASEAKRRLLEMKREYEMEQKKRGQR